MYKPNAPRPMPEPRLFGGLVLHGHHLWFAMAGEGWGHPLPDAVLGRIVDAWNAVTCCLLGHEWASIDFRGDRDGRVLVTVGCTGCGRELGRAWCSSPELTLVGAPDA